MGPEQVRICVGKSFPPKPISELFKDVDLSPAPPGSFGVIVVKSFPGQPPNLTAETKFTNLLGQYDRQEVMIGEGNIVDAAALKQAMDNYHNSCKPPSQSDYFFDRAIDAINNDLIIQAIFIIGLILLGIKSLRPNKRR